MQREALQFIDKSKEKQTAGCQFIFSLCLQESHCFSTTKPLPLGNGIEMKSVKSECHYHHKPAVLVKEILPFRGRTGKRLTTE